MAKWSADTIASRIVIGDQVDAAFQRVLETTRSRIDSLLIELLANQNALVREVAATILGERRKPSNIPALIGKLDDKSVHVRWDALVAIEKCAGLGIGELHSALLLESSKPRLVKAR